MYVYVYMAVIHVADGALGYIYIYVYVYVEHTAFGFGNDRVQEKVATGGYLRASPQTPRVSLQSGLCGLGAFHWAVKGVLATLCEIRFRESRVFE